MKIDLSKEFDEWTQLLQAELAEILEPIGRDQSNYGFALAIPEDAGSACLMYAVGNESKLAGERPGSVVWLDRRYSPVEWVQNWSPVPRSTDALEEIVNEFNSRTETLDQAVVDETHGDFIFDC